MQKRIVNPSYSYQPGGNITISCTLEILDDAGAVVATTSTSVNTRPDKVGWVSESSQIIAAAFQEYINTYKALAYQVLPQFPGATNFEEAITQFVALVDNEVTL